MYCDFVLWTEKDIHIERIYPDDDFWHTNVLSYVQPFFTRAILPELLGKFYSRTSDEELLIVTRPPSSSTTPESDKSRTPTYCYCNGPDEGAMVGCDNPSCRFQWFHFDCLGLKAQPKAKHWYCPDCRKLRFSKKEKKENRIITYDN